MLESVMLPRAGIVWVSSAKPLPPVWLTGVWLTGVWLTGAFVAASWLIGVWFTGVWFTGADCWLDCGSRRISGGTFASCTRAAPASAAVGVAIRSTFVATAG